MDKKVNFNFCEKKLATYPELSVNMRCVVHDKCEFCGMLDRFARNCNVYIIYVDSAISENGKCTGQI